MHTRSEEARVRIFALGCARAMWVAHGSKLVGAFLFVWAGLRLGADADCGRFCLGDCGVYCGVR
jgi:hypothetical protein